MDSWEKKAAAAARLLCLVLIAIFLLGAPQLSLVSSIVPGGTQQDDDEESKDETRTDDVDTLVETVARVDHSPRKAAAQARIEHCCSTLPATPRIAPRLTARRC